MTSSVIRSACRLPRGPLSHPPHETHEQQHISGLQARSHGLASDARIDQLADGSYDRCIGFVDRVRYGRRMKRFAQAMFDAYVLGKRVKPSAKRIQRWVDGQHVGD